MDGAEGEEGGNEGFDELACTLGGGGILAVEEIDNEEGVVRLLPVE